MFKRMGFAMMTMAALLSACGTTGTTGTAPTAAPQAVATTGNPAPTAEGAPGGELRPVTIAMPYIPNVQFAYLYEADKKGYFAEAGLDVTFDYNFENDVPQRLVQDTVQFGLISGNSMLLARAQGLPIVTVATVTQEFPVVFFSKKDQNITTVADLKGKTVGLPGRYGAAYIGLLALLYAEKVPETDLNIQEIGFTQVQALAQDQVQVASGYANNEPLQLAKQGIDLNVIRVADIYPLASDGLAVSEKLLADDPALVRGFVGAMLKGMQSIIDSPQEGYQTALEYIPELQNADDATKQLQRDVLDATIPSWQSAVTEAQGLGYTDKAQWDATYAFLRESGLLKQDTDVAAAFTNDYLK